jgi:ferredoxin-NADP reductase
MLPTLRRFRVIDKLTESGHTFTLVLEPADGEPMFQFEAGQFVMLHLYNADGTTWGKAAFSIATAPVESKDNFELGIKIYGEFTNRASDLNVGDEVGVHGPYGMFVLKPDTSRYVFFAGGIGITPLRCMIRQALLTKLPIDIHLFYSDKVRKAMAYENEFRELAKQHPNFHPVFFLTQERPEDWDGETARIHEGIIRDRLADLKTGRYAMCGPKSFMDMIKDMLVAAGVDSKTQIQRESF